MYRYSFLGMITQFYCTNGFPMDNISCNIVASTRKPFPMKLPNFTFHRQQSCIMRRGESKMVKFAQLTNKYFSHLKWPREIPLLVVLPSGGLVHKAMVLEPRAYIPPVNHTSEVSVIQYRRHVGRCDVYLVLDGWRTSLTQILLIFLCSRTVDQGVLEMENSMR